MWIPEEPDFENRFIYYRYWLRVMRSIQMNSGAIRRWRGKRSYPVRSLSDWVDLLDGKKSTVDEFRKYCCRKRYLGVSEGIGEVFWFVNPAYVPNGAGLPQHIHEYFR